MKQNRNTVEKELGKLILYALLNADQYYSQKAMMLLRNMRVSGYIVVSRFHRDELPFCGLACSIGLGGLGIIFIDKEFLGNPAVPEELKDFVLAHEIAHIVRGHILSKIMLRFLTETYIQALSESIRSLEKAKDVIDALFNVIITIFLFGVTLKLVGEVDPQRVKQEELEADEIAIKLTGCKGALIFAKMLEQLRLQGYNVSHESMLGFPALTIDERIKFIQYKCR